MIFVKQDGWCTFCGHTLWPSWVLFFFFTVSIHTPLPSLSSLLLSHFCLCACSEPCAFSKELQGQDLTGAKFIRVNTHWVSLLAKLGSIILQMNSVLQMLSVTLWLWVPWVICVTEYHPSPRTLGSLDARALEVCKCSCWNSYHRSSE